MSCAATLAKSIEPASGLMAPDDALEQRRLAGAVRPDHGEHRALLHRAIEVMDRRVPVITEREIAELQRCGGHRIAQ